MATENSSQTRTAWKTKSGALRDNGQGSSSSKEHPPIVVTWTNHSLNSLLEQAYWQLLQNRIWSLLWDCDSHVFQSLFWVKKLKVLDSGHYGILGVWLGWGEMGRYISGPWGAAFRCDGEKCTLPRNAGYLGQWVGVLHMWNEEHIKY